MRDIKRVSYTERKRVLQSELVIREQSLVIKCREAMEDDGLSIDEFNLLSTSELNHHILADNSEPRLVLVPALPQSV